MLIHGREPDGQYLFSLRLKYPDLDAASCNNLQTCIHRCPSLLIGRTAASDSDASPPCDYIKRIEALLVDYIHALNLRVISQLTPDSMEVLHHGIVVAGYLYGPFENPAFNILVNAIWYQQQLNLSCGSSDDRNMPSTPPVGMICTDLMLRTGFNSLVGQVAFLCTKYGGTLSGHDAIEYLYITNCNLVAAMELAQGAGHNAISASDDAAAAESAVKAMKHPRPAAMMALMACFTPELEDKLRDILPAKGAVLSCEAIDKISRLLSHHVILPAMPPPVAVTMHQGAMAEIAQKRSTLERRQRFLMEMVQFLLDTNYEARTICAVSRFHFQMQKIYHVNFLATRTDIDDGGQVPSVLFFAQILLGTSLRFTDENNSCQKDWVRSFCCPVTISSCLSRCFPCEFRRNKIVHPIGIDKDYFGRQEKTYLNFINYIASSRHTVYNYKMDSDFLYFEPSVNTELTMYLNQRAKEQEGMTKDEADEIFLKQIPCG